LEQGKKVRKPRTDATKEGAILHPDLPLDFSFLKIKEV
jgi:hypothetical protein